MKTDEKKCINILLEASAEFNDIEGCEKLHFDGVEGHLSGMQQTFTKDIRQKYITLFERYNARVKIIYLETDWNTRLKRNTERENVVPESVIEKMLEKLSPPTSEEAQTVEWHCV